MAAGRLQFENVAYEKGRGGSFGVSFLLFFSPNGGAKRNVTTPPLCRFPSFSPILPPFFRAVINLILFTSAKLRVVYLHAFLSSLSAFSSWISCLFSRHLHAARSVSVLPFLCVGGKEEGTKRYFDLAFLGDSN